MLSASRFFLLVCLTSFFLPFSSFALNSPVFLTATGDLRGEIKPCGCSPDGDMGGLLRRGSYLKQQRSQHPDLLYLDLGNNFPPPSEQGTLKVALIQKALHKLHPKAILVGPNELSYGAATLDTTLPYLLSNARVSKSSPRSRVLLKSQKVSLRGFLSPSQTYQNANESSELIPANSELLQQWEKEFDPNMSYRVLLFRGDEKELEFFAQSKLFDLIITGNNNDDELNQVLEMNTATEGFQSVPTKGQGALQGRLQKKQKSGKANLDVVWLTSVYADDSELQGGFEEYDSEVKDLFFTNLDRMDAQKQNSPYVGAKQCESCHQKEYLTWKSTPHAHAMETLKKAKKHFDPECIQCHTVGFQAELKQKESSGFLSNALTPHLANVQCENCHGAARSHVKDPTRNRLPIRTPKSQCAGCHLGSHSPKFNFKKYWTKIRHP